MNLLNGIKITRMAAATTAGTSTITPAAPLDMQGFEGVVFLTVLGTAATNNGMKAQQGQLANISDAADLAGSLVSSNASDEILMLDIYQPAERYVQPVIVRGTSTTIGDIWAIQYEARTEPVVNIVTGTSNAKILASPAEGTA